MLLFLLFLIFAGIDTFNLYPQDKNAGKKANDSMNSFLNRPDAFGGHLKKRYIDEAGNDVIAVSFPGKPPINYRAPKALMPATAKTLTNFPAYDWSFGCTATSAAMIAGYYDNNGYPNLYTGPTNGGAAPLTNSSWGSVIINGKLLSLCPISATMNGLDGRATRGHVDDYWIQYDNCSNDPYITNGWAQHTYGDCTGDFMKTNQSAYDNCDGSTILYYFPSGSPFTAAQVDDGGYGFQLFLTSKGYTVTSRYNQLIYGYGGNTLGFTFAQYKQEINNGYPVMIHVEGHTMVGFGYDDASNKVYLRDTWDYSTHEMTWGGSYAGMAHWGVTVIHMAPATPVYTINTSSSPAAGGTTSGGGNYNLGQTARVTATANAGYTFINWTEGGTQVSTNASYSFTVSSSRVLVANFQINNYVVSVSGSPAGTGTVSGGGTYLYGTSVQVQAAANTGYAFVNWTENGIQVSASSSYTFTLTANRNLIANFVTSTLTVSTSSNPSAGGTTTGSGTFNYGQPDTVKATPNSGYTFVNWTENGAVISTNPNYGFIVTSNRNFVANFLLNTYTVTASSNPTAGGAATGSGSFTHGQSDTVKATANTGYTFINWTENGTIISTNPVYGFLVTANRNLVANFQINTYTVTAGSSPAAGGATTGSGTFNHGQTDTVKAIPNPGYNFVNWTENGSIVSVNPNFGFVVTSNRNLTANFSLISYLVSTSSNPPQGGATSGSGSFTYVQTDTVKASPNAGYAFVNWTENGIVVSVNPNFGFAVTSNRNLTANFSAIIYTVSVNSNPAAGGTTTGGGNFTYGQPDTIKAMANTGYTFINWTENGTVISTEPNYGFIVTSNRTFTANFSLNTYTVSTNSIPAAGGTTTGSGTFNYGQIDTVKAVASTGYTFVNWTENGSIVSTTPIFGFIVTSSRNLTANFSINTYSVLTNCSPSAGGTATGSGTFNYGQTDTVKAVANTGYTFINWTENGSIISTNPIYGFVVTSNRNLTANFSLNSYTVSVRSNPAAGGTVSGGGSFTHGQTDTVKANANTGYTFVNWTENGSIISTNPVYGFTVTANRNLTANFSINTYTISTSSNPTAGGITTGSGNFTYGQTDTVKAAANTGYTFVNWSENGTVVSTNPNYGFVVNANRNLTANFTLNIYTISAERNPSNGGSVSGTGTYTHGQTARLAAVPAIGFFFVSWIENNIVVSTDANYSFVVTAGRNLTANFSKNSFTIITLSSPVEGGNTSGGGTRLYGDSDTVRAIPAEGYRFLYWTENGIMVSTQLEYIFIVASSRTLVANFSKLTYTIYVTANPSNGGTVSGAGTFAHGAADTVKAAPKTGFVFANWTENGSVVSTEMNYGFTVSSSRSLTANFAYLALTYPAGGETWQSGSFRLITWNAVNVFSIKIEYSINNGQTWNTITQSTGAGEGNYSWIVPNTPSLNCKIRITDTQNPSIYSVNPLPFTIINESVYASLILGSSVAEAGDSVTIPLTGKYLSKIGAISLKIKFDPDKLSFGRIIDPDPQLAGIIAGASPNSIAVSWFNAAGADFNNKNLLSLNFFFKGSADSVPISFNVDECDIMDINGINIPVKYINGSIIPKSKLAGKLLYANSNQTPLSNVKVYLKNPDNVIDSIISNNSGEFTFSNLQPGTYKFAFTNSLPWGGVNATDALLIARRSVNLLTFTGLQDRASDVNLNGFINTTDAYQVMLRSIGLLSSFAIDDWIYDNQVFYYGGGLLQKTLLSLAAADVNASYNFAASKTGSEKNIHVLAKSLNKGETADIPVALNRNAEIGAVSVKLNYNPSILKVVGIESKLKGLVYKISDGCISIAWADVNAVVVNKDEPLFYIKAIVLNNSAEINLASSNECEFTDKNGDSIEGLEFAASVNIKNTLLKFELSANYPNPFNPSTAIRFAIPEDSYVTLIIYNTLGKEIKRLVNGSMKAGAYSINWLADDENGRKAASGVYIYKLTSGNNSIVKKMNLLK